MKDSNGIWSSAKKENLKEEGEAEVTLEQALELLMEDQPVHVFNEDGDDYFFGYKSAINKEEPVPPLVVTGIFANTEDLKDGNGEMQVIELQVKE